MTSEKQYCTFKLGGSLFGLESSLVQEVLRGQKSTPVPLAPVPVTGLMNLRGRIVTLLDLRLRLELPPRPEGMPGLSVILRHGNEWVGLLADEIGDVLDLEEQTFEEAPSSLMGEARRLILGAFKLRGQLLLVLNPAEVVKTRN